MSLFKLSAFEMSLHDGSLMRYYKYNAKVLYILYRVKLALSLQQDTVYGQ